MLSVALRSGSPFRELVGSAALGSGPSFRKSVGSAALGSGSPFRELVGSAALGQMLFTSCHPERSRRVKQILLPVTLSGVEGRHRKALLFYQAALHVTWILLRSP